MSNKTTMIERNYTAYYDFIVVVLGRIISACIALMAIKAVTMFLTPEEFGRLSLIVMVQTFCGLLLISPISQYISRNTHEWWSKGTLKHKLLLYQYYLLFISLIGVGGVLLLGHYIEMHLSLWLCVAMFTMVMAGTWSPLLAWILNLIGFRVASVLCVIFGALVGLLASLLFVQLYPNSAAWFSGQAFGMVVGAIFAWRFLFNKKELSTINESNIFTDHRSEMASYCIPLAAATGAMWLQFSGFRIVIETYWGLDKLGFISLGLLLANQVWSMIESLATQFLHPFFYKKISQNRELYSEEALSDLLNTIGPIYVALLGITIIAGPLLVFLLVDEQFSSISKFVVMGMIMESCRVLANLFGNAAQITKKTSSMIMPYLVGSFVVFLLLFYLGMQDFGVSYAGFSLVIGALSMLLIMVLAMFKQVSFLLDIKRWALGGLVTVSFIMLSNWSIVVENWIDALVAICTVLTLFGVLLVMLLWKNPALERLLSVKIRLEQ